MNRNFTSYLLGRTTVGVQRGTSVDLQVQAFCLATPLWVTRCCHPKPRSPHCLVVEPSFWKICLSTHQLVHIVHVQTWTLHFALWSFFMFIHLCTIGDHTNTGRTVTVAGNCMTNTASDIKASLNKNRALQRPNSRSWKAHKSACLLGHQGFVMKKYHIKSKAFGTMEAHPRTV